MRWLISLALVVLTFSAAAAPGDIMLELMASPAKFTDSLSLGHAFFEAHPAVPGWSICSMGVPCAGDQRRAGGDMRG